MNGLNAVFKVCVVAILVFLAGLVTYQAMDRGWPTESRDRVVETPEVQRHGELRIRTTVTTKKRCRTHTDRFILDSSGARHDLPPMDRASGIGEVGKEEPMATIVSIAPEAFIPPSEIPVGPAIYRTIPTAWCNWTNFFAPIRGNVTDTIFTVIE